MDGSIQDVSHRGAVSVSMFNRRRKLERRLIRTIRGRREKIAPSVSEIHFILVETLYLMNWFKVGSNREIKRPPRAQTHRVLRIYFFFLVFRHINARMKRARSPNTSLLVLFTVGISAFIQFRQVDILFRATVVAKKKKMRLLNRRSSIGEKQSSSQSRQNANSCAHSCAKSELQLRQAL